MWWVVIQGREYLLSSCGGGCDPNVVSVVSLASPVEASPYVSKLIPLQLHLSKVLCGRFVKLPRREEQSLVSLFGSRHVVPYPVIRLTGLCASRSYITGSPGRTAE